MNIKIVVMLAIGLLGLPLTVSLSLKIPIFSTASGSVESWIGFWGSYLGNIVGLFGLYYATTKQINSQFKSLFAQDQLEKDRAYTSFLLENFKDFNRNLSFLSHELDNIYSNTNDIILMYSNQNFDDKESLLNKNKVLFERALRIISENEVYLPILEVYEVKSNNIQEIENDIYMYLKKYNDLIQGIDALYPEKFSEYFIELQATHDNDYQVLYEKINDRKEALTKSIKNIISSTLKTVSEKEKS